MKRHSCVWLVAPPATRGVINAEYRKYATGIEADCDGEPTTLFLRCDSNWGNCYLGDGGYLYNVEKEKLND